MGCGGWWNPVRDSLETGASLAGNYLLPGSSLVTDHLVSKGSQKQLNSPLGIAAQLGTGLAGAGVGSPFTNIPSAASEGGGWGNLVNGAENLASSAGNALGITGASSGTLGDAAGGASGIDSAAGAASTPSAVPFGNLDAAGLGATDANGNPIINASGAAGGALNPNNLTASVAAGNPLASSGGNISDAAVLKDAGIGAGSSISSLATPTAGQVSAPNTGGLWNAVKSAAPAIGPIVSGTGLALSALKGSQTPSSEKALEAQATQSASQGTALQGYLQNGTLPPGAKAGLDQATNSAKAAIRSKYASMGMSGSSSEQQELAAADMASQAQGEQEALNLFNSGINESQLSSQLYQNILNATLQQDQQLSSSIGNFASSIAGAANRPN